MAQKTPFKGLHTWDMKSTKSARQNCRLMQIGSHLLQAPAPSRARYSSWSSPLFTLHWAHSSISVFMVLGQPKRDTALQGWFKKCWMEGKNHLTFWLSSCSPQWCCSPSFTKWTCPVPMNLNPPGPSSHFLQSCSQPNSPQPVLVHRTALFQTQDFPLGFVERHPLGFVERHPLRAAWQDVSE